MHNIIVNSFFCLCVGVLLGFSICYTLLHKNINGSFFRKKIFSKKSSSETTQTPENELDLIPKAKKQKTICPKKTGIEAAKELSISIKLSSNRRHVLFGFDENEEYSAGIAEYISEHQKELEQRGYKVTYSQFLNSRRSNEHAPEDTYVELDW